MARQRTGVKIIAALWNSKCSQTGDRIVKGDSMLYNYETKKCYAKTSAAYKNYYDEQESRSTAAMIDAQECAAFERYDNSPDNYR